MAIQIDTNQSNLSRPVQVVRGIVESKNTMPILANVLIEKKGSEVTFTTSDLNIQCRTHADIGQEGEDFSTTVSAKKLSDILSTINEKENVKITEKGKQVLLQSERSRFELQTLPAADYPLMKNYEFSPAFTMTCANFRYMLSMVAFAAAQNNVRYFLNGVLLSAHGEKITAVATDGHRLALFEQTQDKTIEDKIEAILTKKTVKELLRLVPDNDELIEVEISKNQMRFKFDAIEIISKLIEGKFPDYERVLPKDNKTIVEINREELKAALQQAAVLTSDGFKGVRWNLQDNTLSIASTNAEMEEVSVKLSIDYSGNPLELGFNVNYLLDVLNVLKVEKVIFSLGGPLQSALITIPDSDKFKFVVMPMSI